MDAMDGLSDVLQKLTALTSAGPAGAAKALQAAALDVQGRAQDKAPIDTGHLRESAYTTFSDDGLSATVGFNATTKKGDYSYALIQHERLDYNHDRPVYVMRHGKRVEVKNPRGHRGGEAKYLEKALLEVASDITDRLAEGVQGSIGDFLQ